MAVDEHSVKCFYFAKLKTTRRLCFDTVGITEMVSPWRRGKALLFPFGLVIGIWRRSKDKVSEDFADEQWLGADWLDVSIDDISTWRAGPDEDDVDSASVQTEEGILPPQG